MSLALEHAHRLGYLTLAWKLANDEVVEVALSELEEALDLAVLRTSDIVLCR